MIRAPQEPVNAALQAFYDVLLSVLRLPQVRDGAWHLLECSPAWDGNWTSACFVAFTWDGPAGERLLVTVNYAPNQSQCYVSLPFQDLANTNICLKDLMGSDEYFRAGNDLLSRGLYLDLPPWGYHVFTVKPEKKKATP